MSAGASMLKVRMPRWYRFSAKTMLSSSRKLRRTLDEEDGEGQH